MDDPVLATIKTENIELWLKGGPVEPQWNLFSFSEIILFILWNSLGLKFNDTTVIKSIVLK